MPRIRPTPDTAEIIYRFVVPLPVRVTDAYGLTVEFDIRETWSGRWCLCFGDPNKLAIAVILRAPTRADVETACATAITVSYPSVYVDWFKRLRLRGQMELVSGPHTPLKWWEAEG